VTRPGVEVRVLADPAAAVAELLGRHAAAGHHVALTGGSTPREAYVRAASLDVDWSGATIWFGDERCVMPDDARSNFGMAREALLDRLVESRPRVERIEGELGPEQGAADYERRLASEFGEGMPSLDLVLLGLGADGHCASLFPGRPEVEERSRAVVGVEEAGLEPLVARVSLTLAAIDAACEVVFLVAGAGKADAVARAFASPPDPAVPASLVAPASRRLRVLLDAPAAARLEPA
jgi:6-phosphogluconolactonase